MQSQFIPPYMRAAIEASQGNMTAEREAELKKELQDAALRAQKLDAEYEKRRIQREIDDQRAFTGLAMVDRIPSKAQGGAAPM